MIVRTLLGLCKTDFGAGMKFSTALTTTNKTLIYMEGPMTRCMIRRLVEEASRLGTSTIYAFYKNTAIDKAVDHQDLGPVINVVQFLYMETAKLCGDVEVCFPIRRHLQEVANMVERCIAHPASIGLLKSAGLSSVHVVEPVASGDHDEEPTRASNVHARDSVVIGGTFDRLHNGHRLLLTASSLLANKRLVVGVTANEILTNKVLAEFIQPWEQRAANVRDYVRFIAPGPSGTIRDLDLLVLTEETASGAELVNGARARNGFHTLPCVIVQMVPSHSKVLDDEKVSSSVARTKDLGALRCPPFLDHRTCNPYLIGLTGGIASGKSSLANRLEAMGAKVISADLLGHQAYAVGTRCYEQVIEKFGTEVVNEDGSVNRRRLGNIVFADSSSRESLNQIVWPAVELILHKKLEELQREGARVCVLEAAVLLEAGWDRWVNEVWCSIVPPREAVLRLIERNNINQEEALQRVNSQLTNQERVARSHVVLTTLWSPGENSVFLRRAWEELNLRLPIYCRN